MNFCMMIGTASPQAPCYCSENLFGPTIWSLRKYCKKVNLEKSPQFDPIFNRQASDVRDTIVQHVKGSYSPQGDILGMSLSIDATRCVADLLKDNRHNAVVGGAAPNQ